MDDLVRLIVVPTESEAEMIRGVLSASDIPSMQRQTDFSAGAWDGVPGGGAREVLVRAVDLDAARELIAGE